jgi:hypothetical protein
MKYLPDVKNLLLPQRHRELQKQSGKKVWWFKFINGLFAKVQKVPSPLAGEG